VKGKMESRNDKRKENEKWRAGVKYGRKRSHGEQELNK
jgi:hypothetical protein